MLSSKYKVPRCQRTGPSWWPVVKWWQPCLMGITWKQRVFWFRFMVFPKRLSCHSWNTYTQTLVAQLAFSRPCASWSVLRCTRCPDCSTYVSCSSSRSCRACQAGNWRPWTSILLTCSKKPSFTTLIAFQPGYFISLPLTTSSSVKSLNFRIFQWKNAALLKSTDGHRICIWSNLRNTGSTFTPGNAVA